MKIIGWETPVLEKQPAGVMAERKPAISFPDNWPTNRAIGTAASDPGKIILAATDVPGECRDGFAGRRTLVDSSVTYTCDG